MTYKESVGYGLPFIAIHNSFLENDVTFHLLWQLLDNVFRLSGFVKDVVMFVTVCQKTS